MIASALNIVSKGITNINNGAKMMFWRSNFNMPVPYLFTTTPTYNRYTGCFTYQGQATSFDLSGFSPGFEICLLTSIWDWENNGGSPVTLNELLY